MKEDPKAEKTAPPSPAPKASEEKKAEKASEELATAKAECERLTAHYEMISRSFASAKDFVERLAEAGSKLPAFPQELVASAKDFLARQ